MIINKGELVPDDIINDLIFESLSNKNIFNKIIFDGYPRNIIQARKPDIIYGLKAIEIQVLIILFLISIFPNCFIPAFNKIWAKAFNKTLDIINMKLDSMIKYHWLILKTVLLDQALLNL